LASCPKCGGEMRAATGDVSHNVTVKSGHGVFDVNSPSMYICEKCGYIEFYLKQAGSALKPQFG
jgi:predicted nucleic-acid-binding Zn-ribbon protein